MKAQADSLPPQLPGRWPARWFDPLALKRWWLALVRTVDHEAILAHSRAEADFTFNYAFMVATAAGIATVGLLLNSPAVIIGAMLISPLMGPIVSAGFAITGFDVALGRNSARTLTLGAVVAVACATVIVWLSPVQALTAEILARTRPNLFDLVVAVLSGTAAGYALIRGHGGAIVGVAIATALMPPLAVVGYGMATLQWPVARGSLLLFVTNMAAIALAVAGVAVWYGFGRGQLRQRLARQGLISVLVLAPLTVPLWYSLQSIAWESRVQATTRRVIESHVSRLKQGQLAQLAVRFNSGKPPFVEAIVVSEQSQLSLRAELSNELQQALGAPVSLHLTQLRADDPQTVSRAIQQGAIAPASQTDEHTALEALLRSEVPFALTALEVDVEHKRALLLPAYQPAVGLTAWRDIEAGLQRRHAGWQFAVVPPASGLPAIEFDFGSSRLNPVAIERLQVIVWALQRWGVRQTRLTGHASSTGGTRSLARHRVAVVGAWLGEHGVAVESDALYPVPAQREREREVGEAAFRSVEVALASPAQTP